MKKIFATFVVLMIVASSVFAQDTSKEEKTKRSWFKQEDTNGSTFKDRKLTFAVNLSPQSSSYRSREAVLNDRLGRRFNLNYGLTAEYHYSPTFSVITGANFVAGGGKMYNFDELSYERTDNTTDLVIPEKTKMKYKTRALQVPLIARWTSGAQSDQQNMKMYAQAGIGLNFITRARATFVPDSGDRLRNEDISEDYGNFDMNMTFGIGAIHDFNSRFDTFLGISYSRGFVNMSKNFDKIRNRAWTLDWGFIF